MKKLQTVLGIFVMFALATSLSAATIGLWSTGVCSGANNGVGGCTPGALLAFGANDNNYKYTARADGGVVGTNSSVTESAFGSYVANNSGSEWLSPLPFNAIDAGGAYIVQTTFDLSGFVASSLILSLDVAVDNAVTVKVNGNTVFTPTCGVSSAAAHPWCFEQFFSTTINNAQASGFLAGVNILEFDITNNDAPSPTGLRVQVQGNATVSAVPEPGTVMLLGVGLAGLGLLRRRTT